MATTWVLHTETKGTGAQMVPLESVTTRPADPEPVSVPRKPVRRREPSPPEPKGPHRFTIVDVMTRRALASGANAQEALDVLRGVRSIVDVNVYCWEEEQARWRMLTLAEQRALMDLATVAPDG